MNINEIKTMIQTDEYDFLRTSPHLGSNICYLTLGGSHAYGTNIEGSDVDVRGIATNSKEEILLGRDFEQVVNTDTDTTVYSFKKIVNLLANVNPNTIETLYTRKDQILYMNEAGKLLRDNRDIFLSKKCVYSFGGYANQQLRRLVNKSARLVSQAEREEHIMNSIRCASYFFKEKYFEFEEDAIKLFLDDALSEDMQKEIFMDITLKHYPLRDWKAMWAEMSNIVKDYDKIGHRNSNAIGRGKLAKHMMHLVRLYLMCFDILEGKEISTYREKEHDFLMSIRSGIYLDENEQPTPEFMEMVDEYENKLQLLTTTTLLPDLPDYDKINKIVMDVHEAIVYGKY
jgi:predicted nucleotidyltransferase